MIPKVWVKNGMPIVQKRTYFGVSFLELYISSIIFLSLSLNFI